MNESAWASSEGPAPRVTVEQLIEEAVERTLDRVLKPYLHRLQQPEPIVYTVSEAATVLRVSTDTIGRMIKKGVLDRVPHVEGKTLIPKVSVHALARGDQGGEVLAEVHPISDPRNGDARSGLKPSGRGAVRGQRERSRPASRP